MRFVWVYFDDRIQSKKKCTIEIYHLLLLRLLLLLLLQQLLASWLLCCSQLILFYCACVSVLLSAFFLSLCSRSVICSIIHAHAHKRTHAHITLLACLPANAGYCMLFVCFSFRFYCSIGANRMGEKKIKARNYTLFGAENAWVRQIELEQESSIYRTASCVFNFRCCCCCCCLCIVWPSIVKLSLCTRDRHMSLSIRTHTQ